MTGGSPPRSRRWLPDGLWGLLVRWFRLPRDPPRLPGADPARLWTRRPSPRFLLYLRLELLAILAILDLGVLGGGVIALYLEPVWTLAFSMPVCGTLLLLHVIAWLAVELRYDTTWYLISDRALRLRRGIWLIPEPTISFENVQNVSTRQGPLQRFLGIADVIVETAGGGGGGSQGLPGSSHLGRIEGVADAAAIRDKIRLQVGRFPSVGL